MTQLIIDADTHLTEPPDVWTTRVAKRYLKHVPHMERNKEGRDVWVLDGVPFSSPGVTAVAGWSEPFPAAPKTLEECPLAAYDADARLRYMDEVGIWAQVLYPNVAGFGSQRFLRIKDDKLKLLCVSAYNDFLRDWASADARRLLTIMSIPFWDVDEAVKEIGRNVDRGHRGILFTGEPHRFGLPFLGDRHWDPLWSIAEEAGLPIHFHIGSGEMTSSSTGPERIAANGLAATFAYAAIEMFLKNGLQCSDLIMSGVLPRFPDLQFVSVESGIGWVPFVLEAADHSYLNNRGRGGNEWELLPSEYFARQVYSTYWFETVAPTKLLGDIPVDRILFETDFPHPTCLYGNVHEKITTSLAGATDEQRQRILWQNAADLYGVEEPDSPETSPATQR